MQASAFIALFAAVVVSRIINERGYRQLDAEQKVRLMDGFSTTRMYSLIPVLALVGGFYLLTRYADIDQSLLAFGYFALLGLYAVVRTILNHRKLHELSMPDAYRQTFAAAQIVSLLGLAWFCYVMMEQ